MYLRTIRNMADFVKLTFGGAASWNFSSPWKASRGVSDLSTAKKILIIDDDPDIVPLLTYGLKKRGYGVVGGSDGREALPLASRHMPDLIIIDVNLPGMNGDEAVRILKRDEKLKHIPVILMSSMHEGLSERSEASCAEAYINKPFGLDELSGMVNKFCVPAGRAALAPAP